MSRRSVEWMIVALILLVLGYFVVPFHGGSVHFFSPDTLESEYQWEGLPFGMDVSIFRSKLIRKEAKLVDYLIKKNYWQPNAITQPRWICTAHFNDQWRDGQSDLHRQLYWRDDEWILWSEKNPQLAAAFWPSVLEKLRNDDNQARSELAEMFWKARTAAP